VAVAARWLVGTERVPALLVAANHAWQLLTGGALPGGRGLHRAPPVSGLGRQDRVGGTLS